MRNHLPNLVLLASLVAVAGSRANAQDVTATCKDGTTFTGTSHRGACSRHGGVQSYGMPTAASPSATVPMTTASATGSAPAVGAASVPQSPPATSVPLGGPGQVWVNTSTKVYHCQSDRYYGKTKRGSYMTEAAAKAAGDRPDHGKACS